MTNFFPEYSDLDRYKLERVAVRAVGMQQCMTQAIEPVNKKDRRLFLTTSIKLVDRRNYKLMLRGSHEWVRGFNVAGNGNLPLENFSTWMAAGSPTRATNTGTLPGTSALPSTLVDIPGQPIMNFSAARTTGRPRGSGGELSVRAVPDREADRAARQLRRALCRQDSPGRDLADYFGEFANQIQRQLGADHLDPHFVGIMANGTSGDVTTRDFSAASSESAGAYEKMRHVVPDVAAEIARVHPSVAFAADITLGAAVAELALKLRRPNVEQLQRAEHGLDARGIETRGDLGG